MCRRHTRAPTLIVLLITAINFGFDDPQSSFLIGDYMQGWSSGLVDGTPATLELLNHFNKEAEKRYAERQTLVNRAVTTLAETTLGHSIQLLTLNHLLPTTRKRQIDIHRIARRSLICLNIQLFKSLLMETSNVDN